MLKTIVVVALVGVGAVVACTALLPEEYVFNAPTGLFGTPEPEQTELERRIELPPGFSIGIYADAIKNARFLRFTSQGDLLVSSPRESTVFLLEADRNGDGRADAVRPLLENLDRPHGMDLRDGWLYVAEASAVRRVRLDAERGAVEGPLETVVSGLPEGGNHWTRTLRFGPDGWMYLSIGSSCNVCVEEDPRRAAILRYRPDGSEEQIYATGLRNSVGFDWRPGTGELFATDNGRDFLGDDSPPCELNRIEEGEFYGWPFANGDRVADPDQGAGRAPQIAASIPPAHAFVAHTAPLGMTFYRGHAFPDRYRGAAFVAQHGSWNRTRKSGYRVVLLEWDGDAGIRETDFMVGLESQEDVIGRPVDVAEGPDGALYVSDDYAGAVYRVSYVPPEG